MGQEDLSYYVIELKKGNQSVFNEFYELTKHKVFYNILAIIKNYELSEDLLQDTYVSFLKNIQKVDVKSSILGYLMVISRNLTLDYIKKNKRVRNIDEEVDVLSSTDEETIESSILIEKIKKILKDKEFEIFILHAMNDLTFDEISKLVNRPLGTIIRSYNNSIKKIQKEISLWERLMIKK